MDLHIVKLLKLEETGITISMKGPQGTKRTVESLDQIRTRLSQLIPVRGHFHFTMQWRDGFAIYYIRTMPETRDHIFNTLEPYVRRDLLEETSCESDSSTSTDTSSSSSETTQENNLQQNKTAQQNQFSVTKVLTQGSKKLVVILEGDIKEVHNNLNKFLGRYFLKDNYKIKSRSHKNNITLEIEARTESHKTQALDIFKTMAPQTLPTTPQISQNRAVLASVKEVGKRGLSITVRGLETEASKYAEQIFERYLGTTNYKREEFYVNGTLLMEITAKNESLQKEAIRKLVYAMSNQKHDVSPSQTQPSLPNTQQRYQQKEIDPMRLHLLIPTGRESAAIQDFTAQGPIDNIIIKDQGQTCPKRYMALVRYATYEGLANATNNLTDYRPRKCEYHSKPRQNKAPYFIQCKKCKFYVVEHLFAENHVPYCKDQSPKNNIIQRELDPIIQDFIGPDLVTLTSSAEHCLIDLNTKTQQLEKPTNTLSQCIKELEGLQFEMPPGVDAQDAPSPQDPELQSDAEVPNFVLPNTEMSLQEFQRYLDSVFKDLPSSREFKET